MLDEVVQRSKAGALQFYKENVISYTTKNEDSKSKRKNVFKDCHHKMGNAKSHIEIFLLSL